MCQLASDFQYYSGWSMGQHGTMRGPKLLRLVDALTLQSGRGLQQKIPAAQRPAMRKVMSSVTLVHRLLKKNHFHDISTSDQAALLRNHEQVQGAQSSLFTWMESTCASKVASFGQRPAYAPKALPANAPVQSSAPPATSNVPNSTMGPGAKVVAWQRHKPTPGWAMMKGARTGSAQWRLGSTSCVVGIWQTRSLNRGNSATRHLNSAGFARYLMRPASFGPNRRSNFTDIMLAQGGTIAGHPNGVKGLVTLSDTHFTRRDGSLGDTYGYRYAGFGLAIADLCGSAHDYHANIAKIDSYVHSFRVDTVYPMTNSQ